MQALTFSTFGNSNVLEYININAPELDKQEVLVEMRAIGLNYADIYRRKGNYHLSGKPPYIAGYEGAGVVIESKSDKYKPGQRVAFADVPLANAELVKMHEDYVIPLPDQIDFFTASSLLLQGLTAQYLAGDSFQISKGDTVLIHAASGGVGQLLTQICRLKGAIVIGLSRNENKLQTILDCGAHHALVLDNKWKQSVLEITNNKGVDLVFDSVGSTLQDSFDVTKEKGTVVFYGMSGGDPQAVDPRMLMDTSKTLVGGDLWSYLTSSHERISRAKELFNWIIAKELKLQEPQLFKLSQGKEAHDYLEQGKSMGKVLLIPDKYYTETNSNE